MRMGKILGDEQGAGQPHPSRARPAGKEAVRPRPAAGSTDPAWPILMLQQRAGNQAVAALVALLHTHNGIPTVGRGREPSMHSATGTAPTVQRASLADDTSIDDFTHSMRGTLGGWTNTVTSDLQVQVRRDEVKSIVNSALKAAEVPDVGMVPKLDPTEPTSGSFSKTDWHINYKKDVPRLALGLPNHTGRASEVASTFYHEARHAEQYFRAARYLSSKGRASEVTDVLRVKGQVADAAGSAGGLPSEREESEAAGFALSLQSTQLTQGFLREAQTAYVAKIDEVTQQVGILHGLIAAKPSPLDGKTAWDGYAAMVAELEQAEILYLKRYLEYQQGQKHEKDAWQLTEAVEARMGGRQMQSLEEHARKLRQDLTARRLTTFQAIEAEIAGAFGPAPRPPQPAPVTPVGVPAVLGPPPRPSRPVVTAPVGVPVALGPPPRPPRPVVTAPVRVPVGLGPSPRPPAPATGTPVGVRTGLRSQAQPKPGAPYPGTKPRPHGGVPLPGMTDVQSLQMCAIQRHDTPEELNDLLSEDGPPRSGRRG
jgi:hypothetical protein